MGNKGDFIWLGISGAHRSGTTILAHILNQHPEIGLFVEYGLEQYVRAVDAVFNRTDEIEDYDGRVDASREQIKLASQREADLLATFSVDSEGSDQPEEQALTACSASTTLIVDQMSTPRDPDHDAKPSASARTVAADSFYEHRDQVIGLVHTGPFRPVRKTHGHRMLLSAFRMVFPGRSLRVVGDKMPHFGDKNDIDWLQARLPDFRLLHIVRNPLDVINSSLNRRNKTRAGKDIWHIETVHEAAAEWVREWNWSCRTKEKLGDKMLVIKYEDMARDTDGALRQIEKFLNLSSPLPSAFVPIPENLRLYAMDQVEKKDALAWFGPLASIWNDTSIKNLMKEHPHLPTIATVGGEDLDLRFGRESYKFFRTGLGTPETEGTWTVAETAELEANFGLGLELCQFTASFRAISYCRHARFLVNGVEVASADIDNSPWTERTIAVDFKHVPTLLGGTRIQIEISRPKAVGEYPEDDHRAMGLFLSSISVKRKC
ncbi:sulfotransferase family protein [Nitrospirillum amazonense]|uniref:sulfotransferase family protein n=1 Tax=Nitrospirillum amazonense TaxID=28077 RepID=UPI002412739A|nr:sulfotransferase [Nitrospirillum amazonense]MDG3442656.1 sulfotransferase [Nitrospirillum amazonense]